MKTLKSLKRSAMLAVAVFIISLSGCKSKKPGGKTTARGITVNVKKTGAVGDGRIDDTEAFNTAVEQVAAAGGGTVYVPVGIYLIDADVSVKMKSNVTLDMVDSSRIIRVKPTSSNRYNVIRMINISNSRVIGGKIKGDRYEHLANTGEHGMGICLYQATNCQVINTVVIDCWGDGITVGSQSIYSAPDQSVNCVITGVKSRNNRRQGLTIGGVDSLIVTNSSFTHTNGTLPMAGIDIEPDSQTAERVHIKNCEIAHNSKVGIEMNAKTSGTAKIRNITVQNNYIHHNSYSGYIQHVSSVNFTNNRLTNNTHQGNNPRVNDAVNSVFSPNTYQ